MRTVVKFIDTISEYTGRTALWLAVVLVLVPAYETVARFVFDSPTVWAYETTWMLGASLAVLGWSYTHRHQGHIRVDVLYTRLSPRGKAMVDVVCSLIFFFPLLAILLYSSTSFTLFAWKMKEKLVESSWMPLSGPIKSVIVLGLALFTLQALAQFIRDLYLMIRNRPL